MILVDANIVLHAYHSRSEKHQACRVWVEEAFSGLTPIAIPWITIWAFLRISTNPRAFEHPLSMKESNGIVSSWLEVPVVQGIVPGEMYWGILSKLLAEAQVSGPLVTDAALAALALEHGASVCTTDRDFSRFPDVRTIDPSRG